jgi:hypothetical protein
MNPTALRWDPVVGSCEYGNEPSVSKGREFIIYLNKCGLLRKDPGTTELQFVFWKCEMGYEILCSVTVTLLITG